MEKIIDKLIRTNLFGDKYFLRLENNSKQYVRDVEVDKELWMQYSLQDEYNEK